MDCIICGGNSAGNSICQNCSALEYQAVIRTYCLNSVSKNPLQMAREIMSHPGFPLAGQAHHPLIAAILLAAYRNTGKPVAQDKLEEAIRRADSIPGFCAGFGADAAAIACGIAVSLINGNTVKAEHAVGRAQAHALTGEGMLNIANNSGNRCCKRSVYSMLELATNYFNRVMGASLEAPAERLSCAFAAKNKFCNGVSCRYYPKFV